MTLRVTNAAGEVLDYDSERNSLTGGKSSEKIKREELTMFLSGTLRSNGKGLSISYTASNGLTIYVSFEK